MRMKFAILLIPLQLIYVENASAEVTPKYREIRVNVAFGITAPSSEWKDNMDLGAGFGLHLGIALSRQFESGLYFGYEVFQVKDSMVYPRPINIGENDWTRYSGGIFGEYMLTDARLAPFIGGYLGVQGIHISWAEIYMGWDGEGDYGLGFGLSAGLRYRLENRFGAVFQIQAENSPSMDSGWFLNTRLGFALFL